MDPVGRPRPESQVIERGLTNLACALNTLGNGLHPGQWAAHPTNCLFAWNLASMTQLRFRSFLEGTVTA